MKKIWLIVGFILAFTSPLAQAKVFLQSIGNDAGGGGNAVVCRNPQGQITSAETLDLFEARVMDNLIIKESPITELRERVLRDAVVLEDLNPVFFKNIGWVAAYVTEYARMLPPDIGLEPIEDAFPILNKKGCKIEQLARYLDRGDLEQEQLLIDSEIWAALDYNSRAALYLHETIYRFLRMSGATTSKRSRAIVGQLMSKAELLPVNPKEKIVMQCADKAEEKRVVFTAVLDDSLIDVPSYTLWFSVLNGQPVVTKNTIQIWARLLDDPNFKQESDVSKSNFEDNIYVELNRKKIISHNKVSFQVKFEGAPGENQGKGIVNDVVCDKLPP